MNTESGKHGHRGIYQSLISRQADVDGQIAEVQHSRISAKAALIKALQNEEAAGLRALSTSELRPEHEAAIEEVRMAQTSLDELESRDRGLRQESAELRRQIVAAEAEGADIADVLEREGAVKGAVAYQNQLRLLIREHESRIVEAGDGIEGDLRDLERHHEALLADAALGQATPSGAKEIKAQIARSEAKKEALDKGRLALAGLRRKLEEAEAEVLQRREDLRFTMQQHLRQQISKAGDEYLNNAVAITGAFERIHALSRALGRLADKPLQRLGPMAWDGDELVIPTPPLVTVDEAAQHDRIRGVLYSASRASMLKQLTKAQERLLERLRSLGLDESVDLLK